MALADSVFKMTLQKVHPGGYFWNVARSDRDQLLLRLATETKRLVVIAHSNAEAHRFAERLTLSGMPVFCALDPARDELAKAENSDGPSTIITTQKYATEHGPIKTPLAVHLRAPQSARTYARTVEAIPASVHISFVTPEDATRAETLVAQLRSESKPGETLDITLEDVIDLTDDASVQTATVSNFRRRFPLRP